MSVKSICGVILASKDPQALADFYASALDLVFEREEHGDLDVHFGVDIGEIHFGIHPPENLRRKHVGNTTTSIAFNVDDFDKVLARLQKLGAKQVVEPHDEGFGMVTMFEDPEANQFEVVTLDYEFNA